jgi:hypothetical protein
MDTQRSYKRKPGPTSIKERQQELRLDRIQELAVKGKSIRQIAEITGISRSTVHSNLQQLRQQARVNLSKYIDEYLPHEHQKTVAGLDGVLQGLWESYENSKSQRDKQNALTSIRDTLSLRLEVVANNSAVIHRAIEYVSMQKEQQKQIVKSNGT